MVYHTSPAASVGQATRQIGKCLVRSKVQYKALLFTLSVQGAESQGRGLGNGNSINLLRKELPEGCHANPGFLGTMKLQTTLQPCGHITSRDAIRSGCQRTLQCTVHMKDLPVGKDQGHLVTESLTGTYYICDWPVVRFQKYKAKKVSFPNTAEQHLSE